MTHRAYYSWLLLITLAAWGIRLVVTEKFIGLSAAIDPADGMDEGDYENFAYRMSIGEGYVLADGKPSARRAPGTSLAILPIYLIFGRSLLAARIWFTFLSALTCAAAAWVVRRRGLETAALLTAAWLAVDPGHFYYSLHLWSEPPFGLAITLALGCMLRAVERSWSGWTVLAGVCWAAALLLRTQVLFLAPACLLAAIWLKPETRWRWGRELFLEGAVVLLLISPWLIRNAIVIGAPKLVTVVGGHTFWGAHNGRTFREPEFRGRWRPYLDDPGMTIPSAADSELIQDRQAWRNGWINVRQNWRKLPEQECWKLYRLLTPFEVTSNWKVRWAFAVSWLISLPLAVVGWRRWRQIDPGLATWILLHVISVIISTLFFYGAVRFRHALEPLLIIASALGAVSLLAPQRESRLTTEPGSLFGE